jgi:hypothetical protein
MKSCVGNLGDKFWQKQAETIRNNYLAKVENKKPAPKERTIACREMNIWT